MIHVKIVGFARGIPVLSNLRHSGKALAPITSIKLQVNGIFIMILPELRYNKEMRNAKAYTQSRSDTTYTKDGKLQFFVLKYSHEAV